ncbi:MAG: hypothetical protein ACOYWZ_07145 [Bacillota bacterium]
MKKIILIALLFVITLVTLVACNDTEKSVPVLDDTSLKELAQNPIGAVMATIDYASKDKVILHYGKALIIYDVKISKISKVVDLSKLNVPLNTQGAETIEVSVDKSANEIFIGSSSLGYDKYEGYIYKLDKNILTKTKNKTTQQPFKDFSMMDASKVTGWSSIHCVNISETEKCYLLLKGTTVGDIKIIFSNGSDVKEYNVL